MNADPNFEALRNHDGFREFVEETQQAPTGHHPSPDAGSEPADAADGTTPSGPSLVSPEPGAVLESGSPGRTRQRLWQFRWSAVADADRYHLIVQGATARFAMIDLPNLRSPRFDDRSTGYVAGQHLKGWRWRVRAMVDGEWTAWSEETTFDVEPMKRPERP